MVLGVKYRLGTLLAILSFGTGCEVDPGGDDGAGDGCDVTCSSGESVHACACDFDGDGLFCDPQTAVGTSTEELSCQAAGCFSENSAQSACETACNNWGTVVNGGTVSDSQAGEIPCADYSDSGSCSAWSPANEITLTTVGVYEIDETWFEDTEADPAPLWTCDDATIGVNTAGDAFEVAGANSGEALYKLGLRNGDELLSLNGESLESWQDAMFAWAWLRLSGETEFTLRIWRGGTRQELEYEIVP